MTVDEQYKFIKECRYSAFRFLRNIHLLKVVKSLPSLNPDWMLKYMRV